MEHIEKFSLNGLINNAEFFQFENEIWIRSFDGFSRKLSDSDSDLVSYLASLIEEFYPIAYKALTSEYSRCCANISYFQYRIVSRFLKCNFSVLDNSPDLSNGVFSNFEYIPCPLRGECKFEHVICRPEFNHSLSKSEIRVMSMWFDGMSEDDIASSLCLSPHTVHAHIRNSYTKLGVHSRAEFVKYASSNSIFDEVR